MVIKEKMNMNERFKHLRMMKERYEQGGCRTRRFLLDELYVWCRRAMIAYKQRVISRQDAAHYIIRPHYSCNKSTGFATGGSGSLS